MDKTFVSGYEVLENDFGYFPTFHDDVIEKIEISTEGIILYINMETIPKGMSSYPKVKVTFKEVENYCLEGEIYGDVSSIFDMNFIKADDYIETEIYSSLGASGTIKSKKVQIELQ